MGKMELGLFVSLVILLSLQLGICDAATSNTSLECIQRERAALLRFKEATLLHPSNTLPSWNPNNKDCCSWQGVTCDKTTRQVISLDLRRRNKRPNEDILFANTLDSSLLELKHLTYLDLSGMDFSYIKFPAYLGSLKQLQYLNLSYTFFSGVVPHNLGNLSSLRTLDLSGGRFTNELKVDDLMWATRLSSLEHLDLSGVNLSMSKHVFEVLTNTPSLLFLRLSGSGLDNTHLLHSSINNSTFLANVEHLDLSNNYFDGDFPSFLPNMSSLTFLDLSWNKVNWSSELLRDKLHLKALDLNGNGINGDILGFFKNFSSHKIESLSLGYNDFYGELPQELGELNYLTNLYLSHNHLNGPIPTSLGNLTSLRSLGLYENQLSGKIPISLGELSHLESFDISLNCLETTFSEAHFAKLSKLKELDLSFNNMIRFGVGYDWVPPFQLIDLSLQSSKMGGQFPQWLQTQKALQSLDLSNCSITGSLPAWLRSMNALYVIDVSHNNISGTIPEFSSSMEVLQFSDNMITHLPSNIGHVMPFVEYLNLARNMINGSVPDSLCRMEDLSFLDLSKNHFSGNLPNCWPSGLEVASLSYNQLTGVIPNSIGGASSLRRLHLNANSFTGHLPSTLKDCTQLEILDVGGNNLSGKLPRWIGRDGLQSLRCLRLRNNDFSGTIPRELCQLSYLQVMDLANNYLTGNIPHCFVNFSGMMGEEMSGYATGFYGEDSKASDSDSLSQVMKGVELEFTTHIEYLVNLDLSCNHLIGQIPWELTNLSGLIGLNLSYNHLEGQIPAKIGNLKSLESLDLSNNHLVGEIPQSVTNLNFLSHLNLSNNDLYGPIPTGHQLQTLDDPSIYQGNPLLCGPLLQRKCDEPPHAQHHEDNAEEDEDEDKADKIWFYGIIIAGIATGFWGVIGVMVVKTKWRHAYFRYIELVMAKMLGY